VTSRLREKIRRESRVPLAHDRAQRAFACWRREGGHPTAGRLALKVFTRSQSQERRVPIAWFGRRHQRGEGAERARRRTSSSNASFKIAFLSITSSTIMMRSSASVPNAEEPTAPDMIALYTCEPW